MKEPILMGKIEIDDNSDVIVSFSDNQKYIATFFTYQNIESLRKKNQSTGECLNGKYFWASDMILIETLKRSEIEEVITHLLQLGEFHSIFKLIETVVD